VSYDFVADLVSEQTFGKMAGQADIQFYIFILDNFL
jgi:hypothetical protein